MKQNRIKSPVLWGALAAIALLTLKLLGYDEAAAMASGRVDVAFELICALLAAFGIVNNPTNRNGF